MSINVTLHRNLFRNNQENKKLSNFDYAKKQEIERRRRLRLEQVREQSKVWAKDIREKYEEEKQRQEKCLKQCKTMELKLWQKKNIEKYQKEYEKCLKTVGSAHKAVTNHKNNENINQAVKLNKRVNAAKRGFSAAERIRKSQEANHKKTSVNELKQKSVLIQTDCNYLSTTDSELETLQLLDNISISCDEKLGDCPDYVKFGNYKPNVSKKILSSSDDEDEIRILSDMTSKEKTNKKQYLQDVRQKQNIDFNYDRPLSDYKNTYCSLDKRPFNQVSELIQKRQHTIPNHRSALTEVSNYSSSLCASRSLIDKEKLKYLINSPLKPYYNAIGDTVTKEIQPAVQRVTNDINQTKKKTDNQNASKSFKKYANRRPPEQIPTVNRSKTAGKQHIQKSFDKLTKQLDNLTNEKNHWKTYDTSEYDCSTQKVMKDEQSRQNYLQTAFKTILKRPTVITCPKINANSEPQQKSYSGRVVNVAELFDDTEYKHNEKPTDKGEQTLKLFSISEEETQKKIERHISPKKIEEYKDDKSNAKVQFEKEKKEFESREQKLCDLEKCLENVMKNLYEINKKKNMDRKVDKEKMQIIQSESNTSTSTVSEFRNKTSSKQLRAPLEIVIKIKEGMSWNHHIRTTEKANQEKSVTENNKNQQPLKRKNLQPDANNSVIVIDDTLKPKVKSNNLTKADHKSPEISGESGSTMYCEPPLTVKTEFSQFLDRLTRETFKNRSKNQTLKASKQEKPQHSLLEKDDKPLNPLLAYYVTRLLGMSRDSIDNLVVSSGSEIPTPSESIINVPNNISTSSSLKQVQHLKRFITDNKNFINEVNQTLEKKRLNGTAEENLSVVENVWMETLGIKEKELRVKQFEHKKKDIVSPLKKCVPRPYYKSKKHILKDSIKQKDLFMKPPPTRTSRTCNNVNNTKHNRKNSNVSSKIRSKSNSPGKNRNQTTDFRTRSVSPSTKSPVTISSDSPNQLKSILKSSRNELAVNIHEIIDEVELLRVAGKHEDQILDKYAELTENCSKRISELAQLIDCARVNKQMILDLSNNSTERPNSTEYFEIPAAISQNNVVDDRTSPETLSYQDKKKPSITQMQKFGKSRDSGISLSRPVTSSDFRDSTEIVNELSPELIQHPEYVLNDRHVDKIHSSAEKLHEELQTFGGYIKDLDNSMSKLSNGISNKSKPKPPSSMPKLHLQQSAEQPHELSTIVEVDSSVVSKLNGSCEKPVLHLTENSNYLKPESFPNFDEYLKARVEQFSRNNINNTKYINELLQTGSDAEALEYVKYLSMIDNQDIPSVIQYMEHMLNLSESLKDDIFGNINKELKRRKIIDQSVEQNSVSSGNRVGSSGDESILAIKNTGPTLMTPKICEKIKKKVSLKNQKQFRHRIEQQKTNDIKEFNETKPKTPTKTKKISEKKNDENLTGFSLLQNISNKKIDRFETKMAELGIDWADSTLRRTQKAEALSSSSSIVSHNTSKTRTSNNSNKSDKPIGLREFLTRELMFKSQKSNISDNETSLSSQFLKSLMNFSGTPYSASQSRSIDNTKEMNDLESVFKRTSTPLQDRSTTTPTSSKSSLNENSLAPITKLLHFSGESCLSSVRSDQSCDSNNKFAENKDVPAPDIKNVDQYTSSNSN